jgi:tRNA G18 (ribose-2'-O)-methylase SpoU
MTKSISSYDLFKELNTSDVYNKISRPIIIADDIRTPENMGAIIRLGANIGALNIYFISKKADTFKKFKINKTASGAADKIKWQIVGDYDAAISKIPDDYSVLAIETSADSLDIFDYHLPEKVVFVMGNEVLGISSEILERISTRLHIPIPGIISSLNVTHALSVAIFEWFRQNKNVK